MCAICVDMICVVINSSCETLHHVLNPVPPIDHRYVRVMCWHSVTSAELGTFPHLTRANAICSSRRILR
jgi:hypothetical protein